jgi:hypothetical protein
MRALMAARSPEERLRMAARMFAGAKVLARVGYTGPVGDEVEMRRHIFRRFYGGDFTPEERERILEYLSG